MEPTNLDNTENSSSFITFREFWSLLRRYKKKILLSGVVFGSLFLGQGLLTPAHFSIKGAFLHKSIQQRGMLPGVIRAGPSEILPILQSARIAEQVIQELHLQAEITPYPKRIGLWDKMMSNLRLETLYLNSPKTALGTPCPLVTTPFSVYDAPELSISSLSYGKPFYSYFTVTPSADGSHFALFANNKRLGEFAFGEEVFIEKDHFILQKELSSSKLRSKYVLTLTPMQETIKDLVDLVVVQSDPQNSDVIYIRLQSSDVQQGTEIVNTWMDVATRHFQREQIRIIQDQIQYLDKRKLSADAEFVEAFQQQAIRVQERLEREGFFDPGAKLEFFNSYYAQNQKHLLAIDTNLRALSEKELDHVLIKDGSDQASALFNHKKGLKYRRKVIENLMTNAPPPALSAVGELCNACNLGELHLSLEQADQMHEALLKALATCDHEDFAIQHAKKSLEDSNFELLSLASIFRDPVSESLIEESVTLMRSIADGRNLNTRELGFMQDTLSLQREFFKKNLLELEKQLRVEQEKILVRLFHIRQKILGLVDEQLELAQSQIVEYLEKRRLFLVAEKKHTEEQLQDFIASMDHLPSQNFEESYVQMQLFKHRSTVEKLTELAESKNLTLNLEKSLSGPLDYAMPPVAPEPPKLLIKSAIGIALGLCFGACFFPGYALLRGIPASLQALRNRRQRVAGNLSESRYLLESDRDTLRHLTAFIEEAEFRPATVGFFAAGRPHFAELVTLQLQKKQYRVTAVHFFFDLDPHQTKIEWRLQLNPLVTAYKEYHWVLPEVSAIELLQSKKGKDQRLALAKECDFLLFIFPTGASNELAAHLLFLTDRAVALLDQEPIKELEGLFSSNIPLIFASLSVGENV